MKGFPICLGLFQQQQQQKKAISQPVLVLFDMLPLSLVLCGAK